MADEKTTAQPAKKAAKAPARKPAKAAAPRQARPAVPAAEKAVMVPVEYLVPYGDFKKGDTGRLPISEARRLGWRGTVRETNNDPKK